MKAIVHAWHTEIYPTKEEVAELCKPGEGANTCSWLVMGSKGFECTSLNRPHAIMEKRKNGTMIAMRDGCEKVNNFDTFKAGAGEIVF